MIVGVLRQDIRDYRDYVAMHWPADPARDGDCFRLYEISGTDLRFLAKWKTADGVHDHDSLNPGGVRYAFFRWDDLEPLLEEIDG